MGTTTITINNNLTFEKMKDGYYFVFDEGGDICIRVSEKEFIVIEGDYSINYRSARIPIDKDAPIYKVLGYFKKGEWVSFENPEPKDTIGCLDVGDLFIDENKTETWLCTEFVANGLHCFNLLSGIYRTFFPSTQIKQYLGNMEYAEIKVSNDEKTLDKMSKHGIMRKE